MRRRRQCSAPFRRPYRARLKKTAGFLRVWTAPALVALFLGWWASLTTGITYLALLALLSVRRPRFVDVGRFTAGVWHVPPGPNTPIIGLFWNRHGIGPSAPKAGLDLVIGKYGMGVFALMPRSKWPAYKQARAAQRARRKELEG